MKKIFLELRKDGGKTIKKTWALETDKTYVIGRQKERADIVIEEVSISRTHAEIKVGKSGSATIKDLDSANGTFLDGKQVGKNQIVLLRNAVQIVLGQAKDTLFVREEAADEGDGEAEEGDENIEEEKTNQNEQRAPNKEVKSPHEEHARKKPRKDSASQSSEEKSPARSRSRNDDKKAQQVTQSTVVPEIKPPTRPMPTVHLPKPPQAVPPVTAAQVKVNFGKPEDKKKLLWQTNAGPSNSAKTYINHAISTNDEESGRFLKMLGVKEDLSEMQDKKGEADQKAPVKKEEIATMNKELEKQFYSGLMRKDGRKNGLGFGN